MRTRTSFHVGEVTKCQGVTRRNTNVWLASLLIVAGSARLAMAIGPQYQTIGDPPPAGTLNDVVFLDGATASGTGSVIGESTPDANGNVDLAILTADHVASAVAGGTCNFGSDATNAPLLTLPLSATYKSFKLVDAVNNPLGLREDLAIMLVPNVAPNPLFAPANNFLLAPFAAAPPAANKTNVVSQKFTELGYGFGGTYNPATATYISDNAPGTRRFQNNTVTKIFGNASDGTYFNPLVNWQNLAPSAAGGGASFGGDSGGPYLTGGASAALNATWVTNTPSFNGAANPPLDTNTAISINLSYTDYESAVHVSGDPGAKVVDGTTGGYGIPLVQTGDLTTGTYDWAEFYANNPIMIPEPASFVLVALGGFSLLLLGYRRRQTLEGVGPKKVTS